MRQYSDDIQVRLTARHKKCMKFCGSLSKKRILNIGCYNGWFEKFAIKNECKEIIAIDTNKDNLAMAGAKLVNEKIKFINSSVLDLAQFNPDYFDLITMFDVIEHLPRGKEDAVLLQVKRVLADDGMLVISTPNNSFAANVLDPAWYFGHRHYSKKELKKVLRKNGFRISGIECGGGFYELFSMIFLYLFKWILKREIPFKGWFDKKRDVEYLDKSGFVTLFIKADKI